MAIDSGLQLRDIEDRLSRSEFRGVPLGSALAQLLYCELYLCNRPWNVRSLLKDWTRFFYHHLRQGKEWSGDVDFCRGRVLVTCITPNFRITNMVFPVAERLADRCVLFYGQPSMADSLPRGVVGLDANQAASRYDRAAWRRDYFQLWPALRPVVKQIVREFALPRGAYYRLADAVVSCTRWIAGCQDFLRRAQPAAIVTEYDRNDLWAPLVLSAKGSGIPTYTLMHGVLGDMYDGFYRLLADKICCWGEISADALAATGVERSRIVIGGCPRLNRDLPLSLAEARVKMGLDPHRPVAMLATQNFSWQARLQQAKVFCSAIHENADINGVVRLHPMDDIQGYAKLISQYPSVKFQRNNEYSLDESIAAADVVIVHSSGFGSDALVKRRLTVVLDACREPLNHGRELIEVAGAPRATSVETLSDNLRRLLFNEQERDKYRRLAEEYVRKFCAYFGDESARRIAGMACEESLEAGSSSDSLHPTSA